MNIDRLHNIFFLGIGGIGMSALARYFNAKGVEVSGYDKTPSDLTCELQQEGIKIWFEDRQDIIPTHIDLVVYTPAVPKTTVLFNTLSTRNIPMIKRAELLGLLTRDVKTIAIAGTHGKTTISTLVTHILKTAEIKTIAFLGGISVNYKTNFLGDEYPEWAVVEADEFDRSFLHLHPDVALISAIDADHLDVYGSEDAIQESFREFVQRIKPDGTLVVKKGIEPTLPFDGRMLTYNCNPPAGIYTSEIKVSNGKYFAALDGLFQASLREMGLPGRHNLENALGAAAIAWSLGIDNETITKALSTFRGVKRRFETCYQDNNTIYIDDYAHHPVEIRACIHAARELYPKQKVTVIFQPHLYSRTRDLAAQFCESLALADALWLMDIYPARELPIEGVSSEMLLEKIKLKEKHFVRKEEITGLLDTNTPEVLLTMGAGDVDRLVPVIVETLKKRKS
ncbi:MAG: UDP-N-acetylmuramate--L-alanine ligase [Bacteroidales bacterium]|jgi:UDP-N-acetylmuramate--alanine ligase|nr:UDP-N-acetylmuramate--L-alanine ligase [Bacteroidales bacterium]NLM92395.1 UDP-N-acetylmuramate--L-alanine ligase [Bacteroidales bacterium]